MLTKYLSVTRRYSYRGVQLTVPPEVFHPGFFFSTRLLLRYINRLPLRHKSLLELGAGSGLISFYAARKGARVTASDINPVAVEYLEKNKTVNGVAMEVIHSDLFGQIPLQTFDIIAINPPYYKRAPRTYAEHAWYCGENGEYFARLFETLPVYMHVNSTVLLILNDACDLVMIREMAKQHGCSLACVYTRRNLLERNFIFKITQV